MLLQTTRKIAPLVVLATAVALGLVAAVPTAGQGDGDVAAKIENAMSAAPQSISEKRDDPRQRAR
jgi:hypothetical protein